MIFIFTVACRCMGFQFFTLLAFFFVFSARPLGHGVVPCPLCRGVVSPESRARGSPPPESAASPARWVRGSPPSATGFELPRRSPRPGLAPGPSPAGRRRGSPVPTATAARSAVRSARSTAATGPRAGPPARGASPPRATGAVPRLRSPPRVAERVRDRSPLRLAPEKLAWPSRPPAVSPPTAAAKRAQRKDAQAEVQRLERGASRLQDGGSGDRAQARAAQVIACVERGRPHGRRCSRSRGRRGMRERSGIRAVGRPAKLVAGPSRLVFFHRSQRGRHTSMRAFRLGFNRFSLPGFYFLEGRLNSSASAVVYYERTITAADNDFGGIVGSTVARVGPSRGALMLSEAFISRGQLRPYFTSDSDLFYSFAWHSLLQYTCIFARE